MFLGQMGRTGKLQELVILQAGASTVVKDQGAFVDVKWYIVQKW